jgi:hypothetical protein
MRGGQNVPVNHCCQKEPHQLNKMKDKAMKAPNTFLGPELSHKFGMSKSTSLSSSLVFRVRCSFTFVPHAVIFYKSNSHSQRRTAVIDIFFDSNHSLSYCKHASLLYILLPFKNLPRPN